MGIIAEIVTWIFINPFLAACQAVVGLLYPARSENVRKLQYAVATLLIMAILLFGTALLLSWAHLPLRWSLVSGVAGLASLLAAATAGYVIEEWYKRHSKPLEKK